MSRSLDILLYKPENILSVNRLIEKKYDNRAKERRRKKKKNMFPVTGQNTQMRNAFCFVLFLFLLYLFIF